MADFQLIQWKNEKMFLSRRQSLNKPVWKSGSWYRMVLLEFWWKLTSSRFCVRAVKMRTKITRTDAILLREIDAAEKGGSKLISDFRPMK